MELKPQEKTCGPNWGLAGPNWGLNDLFCSSVVGRPVKVLFIELKITLFLNFLLFLFEVVFVSEFRISFR